MSYKLNDCKSKGVTQVMDKIKIHLPKMPFWNTELAYLGLPQWVIHEKV